MGKSRSRLAFSALKQRWRARAMSSQQLADVLLAHWQLLWPLPPAERIKKIDEIRADYEFEEKLQGVAREMELAS